MKIFIIDSHKSWHTLPDSCLANAGKPFFIPEFTDDMVASVAPLLRINRLGKTVAPRFAERYFSSIIPSVHFHSPTLRNSLLEMDESPDMSYAFDRSLITSEPIEINPSEPFPAITLRINGVEAAVCRPDNMNVAIGDAINLVSLYNTLKMGDLVAPGISGNVKVKIGDVLALFAGDSEILRIDIK